MSLRDPVDYWVNRLWVYDLKGFKLNSTNNSIIFFYSAATPPNGEPALVGALPLWGGVG